MEPIVQECVEVLNKRMPEDFFSFYLTIDYDGSNNAFEVKMFKDRQASIEGEGNVIWSNTLNGIYPSQDINSFVQKVQEATSQDA